MATVVAVFVGARVIDLAQQAMYSARSVFVISDRGPEIAARIMKEMHRGVTLLGGTGGYTGKSREVIFVIVGRNEIVKLKHLIQSVDSSAFISRRAGIRSGIGDCPDPPSG